MRLDVIHNVVRMPAQWRLRLLQLLTRIGVREDMLLVVIAALIGLGAGAAAWVFERTLVFMRLHFFVPVTQATHATTYCLYILPLVPAAGGSAALPTYSA